MKRTIAVLAAAASMTGSIAYAQDDFSGVLKARQGQMYIQAINLGILGGMAKGEIEYNAEDAQDAADTLVAVSMIQQGPHWSEGSDNMAIEKTRALPAIWDNFDDFLSKWDEFGTAAAGMAEAAGTGQAALGPALGKVGGTCKACHDDYRAPDS